MENKIEEFMRPNNEYVQKRKKSWRWRKGSYKRRGQGGMLCKKVQGAKKRWRCVGLSMRRTG